MYSQPEASFQASIGAGFVGRPRLELKRADGLGCLQREEDKTHQSLQLGLPCEEDEQRVEKILEHQMAEIVETKQCR